MQCPKCKSVINDNTTVCPKCHKVIMLECPNCHNLGESAACEKCGYTILVKCVKCGKLVPVSKEKCRCGIPTAFSVANQECESDELASLIVKFGALKAIKRQLKSQELYTKFLYKLKNLLLAQIKGVDCKLVIYDDIYAINFNKELSFPTSANKAVRLALKIVNAFVNLNANIVEEFAQPLNLSLTIIKKSSEELLKLTTYENNVRPLSIKKESKKYLKGFQLVLDQYIRDEVSKEYKTDSLYSIEDNGTTTMFYEVLLGSYVLPPSSDSENLTISPVQKGINKEAVENVEKDQYSFKVFDINAKCTFEKCSTVQFFNKLSVLDLDKHAKIISLKTTPENAVSTPELVNFYEKIDYKVLYVNCTEALTYKPWGFFEALFREYFNLSPYNKFVDLSKFDVSYLNKFQSLFDFLFRKPLKAMSSEDARFAYMEQWNRFLLTLKDTAIIVDGFENLDDTSIQTLELYFDKFKNIKPNFVFITSKEISVHSKLKGLLRTNLYTEFALQKTSMDECLELIKADASDFIQSFYFEKIKENFNGSYLYFDNAIKYLKDTGVLLEFENKLLIKNKKSVILPLDLKSLCKSRMKFLGKNSDVSFIFAYLSILGARLDFETLKALGIKDLEENLKVLSKSGFVRIFQDVVILNNYSLLEPIITASLKREAENFLVKNIMAQLGKGLDDATLGMLMGRLSIYKDEYLTLWKNAQFSIKTGDFDAYLKNCLGFLSLVEFIESNISKEEIEENKKDVYNNILMCLYSYSPAKIYFIENMLLMDAINEGDDDKIVKLSNLMLQGALITSNYTDALGLLHNILSRMTNPTLMIDGEVNTKFLLLSLVNIEILYNIGDFRQCIEIADEILKILSPEILEQVKPASFSINLFVSHILETLRLVAFAKLYVLDEDIEAFFENVKQALDVELPEKDCVLAVKDYLSQKVYETGNVEEYSAFSKVVFLILQEFSNLESDYKRFAQNIYQAKLLALDIHHYEVELFCDLLIAFAYSKIGIVEKSEFIYRDVLGKAEKSAMFNILMLSRYFLAKLKMNQSASQEALMLINDTLALLRKYENQSKIFYAIFERLYIDIVTQEGMTSVDIEAEEQNLIELKDKLKVFLA